MHFQTKVLIVSVLIVCVMAGAIGSFWYRQTSKQAQSSAERYIRQRSGAAERLV